MRTGVETVLNPYDEYALEAALQLKERAGGDTTRHRLFDGARVAARRRCARRSRWAPTMPWCSRDAGLEGSDVWATCVRDGAGALRKLDFDLLIVGGLTDDSSTGAVPGALAEHLGLPCVTNARKVEITDGELEVERETDTGYQTVRTPLPALLDDRADLRRAALRVAQRHHGREEKDDRHDCRSRISRSIDRSARAARRPSCAASRRRRLAAKGRTVEATDGASGAQAIFEFLQEKKLV